MVYYFEKSGTIAWTNSTKSPSSGAGNISEPRLSSQGGSAQSRERVDQRFSVVRAVVVPVSICLRISCNHVSEAGGP